MAYLPVALNLEGRKVVIIGGGNIALQKVITLQKYNADIFLYGTTVFDFVRDTGVRWEERTYSPALLEGASIVYGATDNWDLNRTIGEDARAIGAIVNVVDDPKNCDFVSPAIEQREHISIAVTSNGKAVLDSIKTRNIIREILPKDHLK